MDEKTRYELKRGIQEMNPIIFLSFADEKTKLGKAIIKGFCHRKHDRGYSREYFWFTWYDEMISDTPLIYNASYEFYQFLHLHNPILSTKPITSTNQKPDWNTHVYTTNDLYNEVESQKKTMKLIQKVSKEQRYRTGKNMTQHLLLHVDAIYESLCSLSPFLHLTYPRKELYNMMLKRTELPEVLINLILEYLDGDDVDIYYE